MGSLYQEKAAQAEALLLETGIDCWLTFVRETTVTPDPGVELVVGSDVTWNSAFLFGKGGQRIAIVGRYDAAAIRTTGIFAQVIGYDEGLSAPLIETLNRLDPQTIGLNYSIDDKTKATITEDDMDGINHLYPRNELAAGQFGCAAVHASANKKLGLLEFALIVIGFAFANIAAGRKIKPGRLPSLRE